MRVSVGATRIATFVVRLAVATIRAFAASIQAVFGNAKASVIDRLTKQTTTYQNWPGSPRSA